jgi:Na+/H+ antiporter NhaD/arsenite permease-like protein
MIAGRLPWLALDRTGIAVLGAIAALIVTGDTPTEAARAIDFSTLGLLLGLMIISAQLRLGGAYTWLAGKLSAARMGPSALLLAVVLMSGGLSAVLANDIIALALAPPLIDIARQRRLSPIPYLLGLAAGANAGSAATLIGNPQNILIGQSLDLSFARYLFLDALLPSAAALLISWGILHIAYRKRWSANVNDNATTSALATPATPPAFNRYETAKGALAAVAVSVIFIGGWWDRDVVALAAAGALLTSRKLASRRFLALVDWQLLALFSGLFVVNDALEQTGAFRDAAESLSSAGIDIANPAWLFGASTVLSNLVSNVPATLLLLPYASHATAGPVLALSSTLAGNFIIVASIANIIVVEQAQRLGVRIDWRTHARTGIPITLLSLAVAGLWMLVRY